MEDSVKIPPPETSTKDFASPLMEASSSSKIQAPNHQISMESKDTGDGSHLKLVILNNLIRHSSIHVCNQTITVTVCSKFVVIFMMTRKNSGKW